MDNSKSNSTDDKKVNLYKVILVGDASVGKTSLLQRFINNKFKFEYNCTIGVDYNVKSLKLNDETTVDLQLWDTCGQERFRTITRQYYRDSNGCIIIFDLSKQESFKNLELWTEDVRNFGSSDIQILLVGNKSDLVDMREVSPEEIEKYCSLYNFNYVEISAMNGSNVRACFEQIAMQMCSVPEKSRKRNTSGNGEEVRKRILIDNRGESFSNSVEIRNKKKEPKSKTCC